MRIKNAKYEGDYRMIIEFDEGRTVEADFEQFLLSARNPMTRQFLDKNFFKKVEVSCGSLSWMTEMDIHYLDIYYDRIPGVKIHEIHSV